MRQQRGGPAVTASPDAYDNVRLLRHPVTSSGLHRRWKSRWSAVLHGTHGRIACEVIDISAGGAQLIVGPALLGEETVSLVVPGFGSIDARVAWRRRDRLGIQFTSPHSWIIDFIKRAATEHGSTHVR
jgi:hypothetical protein